MLNNVKAVVICSPTAKRKYEATIQRLLKGKVQKNNITFRTTDLAITDMPQEIIQTSPQYVIAVDVPQGTMDFVHTKTHAALNGSTPGFFFVSKKINQHATPLPASVTILKEIEDITTI